MKTLICPYISQQEWVENFFPGYSLCSLPLAGKPCSEYLIDLAFMLRCREILVLDYDFSMEFSNQLQRRETGDFSVRYMGSELMPTLDSLLKKHKRFVTSADCLIFFGAVMPDIASVDELLKNIEPVNPAEITGPGVFLRQEGQLFRCISDLHRMESLADFYELNFTLLNTPKAYTISGYSTEKGVFLGDNVEIMTTNISAPLVLNDHCSIAGRCVLKNGVIVGKNAVIDQKTTLERTIVFDNVFIGGSVELVNKIVCKNRIIDPAAETSVPLEQYSSAAVEEAFITIPTRTVSCLTALFLGILSLPLWAFLTPLYLKNPKHPWLYTLSYDRYAGFWLAALGLKDLIYVPTHGKSYLFRASDAHVRQGDEESKKLDDLYYLYHNSPGLAVKIVTKALSNRWSEKRLK